MMTLEQFWKQQLLPEGAEVEIQNPEFARQEGGKLIFASNEEVIGEYDPRDTDGGRSIYGAATVTFEGTEILFQYREKMWTGLQVLIGKVGERYVSSPPFDEELPAWAVQEEEEEL